MSTPPPRLSVGFTPFFLEHLINFFWPQYPLGLVFVKDPRHPRLCNATAQNNPTQILWSGIPTLLPGTNVENINLLFYVLAASVYRPQTAWRTSRIPSLGYWTDTTSDCGPTSEVSTNIAYIHIPLNLLQIIIYCTCH